VKAVTILKRGRARIKRYGLHKGDFGNSKVGYCSLGALSPRRLQIWGTESQYCLDAASHLFLVYDCHRDGKGFFAVRFNDNPATTKQDVLELYDVAIALAAGAGI
jgi:hypothetical protein